MIELDQPVNQAEADPPSNSVVTFRQGNGCPIFFVGGMAGSAEGFTHLATQIASRYPEQDHPIYFLNTHTRLGPLRGVTVESLAAVQAVKAEKIVPRGGKAVLIGHSFGGTVAFETARQLRQRGILDPLPVVIDMSAVNAPGRPRRTRSRHVLDTLRNLPPWLLYEAANFNLRGFLTRLHGHASRVVRTLTRRPGASELDPRIYLAQSNVPEPFVALLRSMHSAMLAYKSKPYEGRVVLLRARVPILSRGRDPLMGWTTVARGGVERYLIAGKHGDCTSDRYAPQLAGLIARCAAGFASNG